MRLRKERRLYTMPTLPSKVCAHPGCRALVSGRPRCDVHTRAQTRAQELSRDPATAKLYNNVRWRAASRSFLARNPICVRCTQLADVVDHITPHRGDYILFWDATNWQSLCKRCHDRKTSTEDRQAIGGGYSKV